MNNLCTSSGLFKEHSSIDGRKVEHVAVLQAQVAKTTRLAGHDLFAASAVAEQRERETWQVKLVVHTLEQLRRHVRVHHIHAHRAFGWLHPQRLHRYKNQH